MNNLDRWQREASVRVTWTLLLFGCSIPFLSAQEAAPRTANSSTVTLRSSTNLVVVDVVVTGADGRPMHGLKREDFLLMENDRVQALRSVEEHVQVPLGGRPVSPPMLKLPPGGFTNYAPIAPGGPVNILLLDTLNTPLRDQAFVRQQLLEYLKKSPPGEQIAIFGLSERLRMLQGVTADASVLRAAVTGRNVVGSSSLLDDPNGGTGNDQAGTTSIVDTLSTLPSTPDLVQTIANVQQFEADQVNAQLQMRAQITLDAFNQLGRYLANIPGRKNLIWFSGSVPINLLPNGELNDAFRSMGSSEQEFRETSNLLARSQVAIYPVDAGGLTSSPTYSAATRGPKYVRDPGSTAKDEMNYTVQRAAETTTMRALAEATGGKAFFNTNALHEAVAKSIEDGSNFYTLAYSPEDMQRDGRYRKIEVRIDKKPSTLSYRRGYYTDDPDAAPSKRGEGAVTTLAGSGENSAITRAMMWGGPAPTQILVTVSVLPAVAATDPGVVRGNKLIATGTIAHGPFARYAVELAIYPRDFDFLQSGGERHGAIDFLAFVYDGTGALINTAGRTVHTDLSEASYVRFIAQPFTLEQDVSVPAKGTYFLRVVVHDRNSDGTGAVEIPVDSVKALSPLAPANQSQK
jgi:VWFA-related protein